MEDKRAVSREERVDPAELKNANQLVANFIGLIKSTNLYPKGHQMLLQTLEKFYSHLKQMLERKENISLKILRKNFYVSEVGLTTYSISGLEDLIAQMQKRYIRHIAFNAGTDINEIAYLIDLLNADPENITAQEGASFFLSSKGVKNIKIIEFYSRRYLTLDQEKLLALTSSEIFNFFINDNIRTLDAKNALFLYELLHDSKLTCELIKVAARYILRDEKTVSPESGVVKKILKKIQEAILSSEISEDEEVSVIMEDVLNNFDEETIFNLAFENFNDKTIEELGVLSVFSKKFEFSKTANLIAKKFIDIKQASALIGRTKQFLGLLFPERQSLLEFLPLLKDKLEVYIKQPGVAKKIFNDIFSSFDQDFSIEDDVELSLGDTPSSGKNDIIAGLNMLKTVHFEKDPIERSVAEYDVETNYILVLQELLYEKSDSAAFQNLSNKLVELLKEQLKNNNFPQARNVFSFLAKMVSLESNFSPGEKMSVINLVDTISLPLLEHFVVESICKPEGINIASFIDNLHQLFKEKLTSFLIKICVKRVNIPNNKIIQDMLSEKYAADFSELYKNLHKEPPLTVARILDLLSNARAPEIIPLLWDITFHEDLILSQRALKLIAEKKTEQSLQLLIKATEHPNLSLRTSSIEYLPSYKHKDAVSCLAAISRGSLGFEKNPALKTEFRLAALKSLLKIDPELAKQISREITGKKRFLFFYVEPPNLISFAKQQLKN